MAAEQAESGISVEAANLRRRFRLQLFLGTLLLLGTIYKGPGGYLDLHEYLEDTNNLWRKGDMSLSGKTGEKRKYHRFAPGLPVLSGPFLGMGILAERATGKPVANHVVVVMIPLLAALAGLVLLDIVLLLGYCHRVAAWCFLIFLFGSPLLNFSRMYYTEVPIVLGLLGGVWAWLKAQRATTLRRSCGYLMLTGLGFGTAVACHYITTPLVAGVGLAFAVHALLNRNDSLGVRSAKVVALAIPPVLIAGALLLQNYLRHGHPLLTGYNVHYQDYRPQIFTPDAIGENTQALLFQFARTVWLLPALIAGALVLRPKTPALFRGFLAGALLQQTVWLFFFEFHRFATRYEQATFAFVALALAPLAAALATWWPRRGLFYAGLLFVMSNVLWLVKGGDDWSPPFQIEDGRVNGYVWYETARFFGAVEWSVFFTLLIAGSVLLWRGTRLSRELDELNATRS